MEVDAIYKRGANIQIIQRGKRAANFDFFIFLGINVRIVNLLLHDE
jgi:hypothetical protein